MKYSSKGDRKKRWRRKQARKLKRKPNADVRQKDEEVLTFMQHEGNSQNDVGGKPPFQLYKQDVQHHYIPLSSSMSRSSKNPSIESRKVEKGHQQGIDNESQHEIEY